MNSIDLAKLWEIVWSILAIGFGAYGVFFTEKSIKNNTNRFRKLYEKTHFPLFKSMARDYDSTSQRMVTVLVGVIFIIVGILNLIKYA